jgi:hypothetical protein
MVGSPGGMRGSSLGAIDGTINATTARSVMRRPGDRARLGDGHVEIVHLTEAVCSRQTVEVDLLVGSDDLRALRKGCQRLCQRQGRHQNSNDK